MSRTLAAGVAMVGCTLLLCTTVSRADETYPSAPALDLNLGDPSFSKAQKLIAAGKYRAGVNKLDRRMQAVRTDISRAFGASNVAKMRSALERFTAGAGPALVVRRDRFFFNPHLYRLLAYGRMKSNDPMKAEIALCRLFGSGQSDASDRRNAQFVLDHLRTMGAKPKCIEAHLGAAR